MKNYRVALIDTKKHGLNKVLWGKPAHGIKEARTIAPFPCHYSQKSRCFIGHFGQYTCLFYDTSQEIPRAL